MASHGGPVPHGRVAAEVADPGAAPAAVPVTGSAGAAVGAGVDAGAVGRILRAAVRRPGWSQLAVVEPVAVVGSAGVPDGVPAPACRSGRRWGGPDYRGRNRLVHVNPWLLH
nr:hypothetical protein [Corynebacterium glutamicum]